MGHSRVRGWWWVSMGVRGGDHIIGAVGSSPVHCDWDWWRGWRHNRAVVHQWVYHCYDDNTVIVSYGAGSPSACARRRGRGAG